MPPFAQAQPFELAREIDVLTREPAEPQPPHWGWRTIGGHRDPLTGETVGMVPSPHYWLAPTPEPEAWVTTMAGDPVVEVSTLASILRDSYAGLVEELNEKLEAIGFPHPVAPRPTVETAPL